ncbi:MAG: hypothetical protein ACJ8DC_10665 [Gemmatimonadales bacterium]
MDSRLFVGGMLVLVACAQNYASPTRIMTDAAPQTVFECVRQQFGALEYKQTSYDTDALRINGTKIDLKTRRADTQFRRMLDKLEVDVSPDASGQTGLSVTARTFAEYTTQRGPTEVEEKPSSGVKSDAQRLIERCHS